MSQTIWKYNDLEFEFDIEDYDDAQRYEKAFNDLSEREKSVEKTGMTTDILKSYCEVYYKLFDDLFGEGAGNKVFGGKFNTRKCEEAFNSFFVFVKAQTEEAQARKQQMALKYKPKHK